MLRVDELNEPQELRDCIRDLVALSTLPAIWKDYNSRQIADSVAAALIAMLVAHVIYGSAPGLPDEKAVEVVRTSPAVSAGSPGHIQRVLRAAWLGTRDQTFSIDNPLGQGALHVAAVSMGFGGAAGIVTGSLDPRFPSETHRLLLRIASSHATLAVQRWHAETQQRRMASLIERSSEFVGVAGLEGPVQYVNKAGCELV